MSFIKIHSKLSLAVLISLILAMTSLYLFGLLDETKASGDYYVYKNYPAGLGGCNDVFSGINPEEPWCTISHAAGVLGITSLETVYVGEGIYSEQISYTNSFYVYFTADLTGNSSSNWSAGKVIVEAMGNDYGFYYNTGGSVGVCLNGFEIRNANIAGVWSEGLMLCEIKNSIIQNNEQYGIYSNSDIGSKTGNSFSLTNNLIYYNGTAGIYSSGNIAKTTIQNNTFYQNDQYGIYATTDIKASSSIQNNIFDDNNIAIMAQGIASGSTIIYNDFWQGGCNPSSMCTNSSNQSVDPQFQTNLPSSTTAQEDIEMLCHTGRVTKNCAGNSLVLSMTSPLIDAGTGQPPLDPDFNYSIMDNIDQCYIDLDNGPNTIDLGFHYHSDFCPNYNLVDMCSVLISTMQFQIRTADTEAGLTGADWLGPDGTSNTYYKVSGQALNIASPKQYIQYKIDLLGNGFYTPLIEEVKINYQK